MDFTSLLPVTSGHCTEWQKPGHNASPGHWRALTQVCYADHAVEKSFLVAQPLQLVARGTVVGSVQAVAAAGCASG